MDLAYLATLIALAQAPAGVPKTTPEPEPAASTARPAVPAGPGIAGIRNVLLVVIDTLRADHLGCYDYPRATSPNIDRLAGEGVLFRQCYTAWPETCQSMAAMLSGLYCQTNGVVCETPQRISREINMLPETLAKAGVQTAAFVMNPVLSAANGYDQGFGNDYIEGWDRVKHPAISETDLAREWLFENGKKGPFFVWVHLVEPHSPYLPIKPGLFVGDRYYDPTRQVVLNDKPFDAFRGIPGTTKVAGHTEHDWYVAQYDSEVFDGDRKVGALLETLKQQGLDGSTLVIFTADHGEGLGEHEYYWHGALPYDQTARVPLVMRAKGIPSSRVPAAVSTVDVAPTILDVMGLPIPEEYEGRSLLPALRDPKSAPPDRLVFTESGDVRKDRNWQRAVRDSRWKLVYVPGKLEQDRYDLEQYQLYDIAADPGETKNLAEEQPAEVRRLTAELDGWIREDSVYQTAPRSLDEMSEEERASIRGLGYVVGEGEKEGDGNPASDAAADPVKPEPAAAKTQKRSFEHIDSAVLVIVDGLRADHMSCYGYPRATTPNLDQLAKNGLRFERAYAARSDGPGSTAAVLSGRNARSLGVTGPAAILPDAIDTLAESLRAQDWQTAFFTNDARLSAANGFAQGFGDDFVVTGDTAKNPQKKSEVDLALRWLEAIGDAEKFLLVVHLDQPCAPWMPRLPARFMGDKSYDASRKVLRAPEGRECGDLGAFGGLPGGAVIDANDELAFYVARYDAEIAETDARIGLLTQEIGRRKFFPRTAVIVVGAQGAAFGEHGFFGHGSIPYDEEVRVPLIIRARGSGGIGVALTDVASGVDLAPTLLDMFGLPARPDHDGRSLVGLLKQPKNRSARLVYSETGPGLAGPSQLTARNRSWKLVWTPDAADRATFELPEFALFDLTSDPAEQTNDAEKRPDVLKSLRESLQRWVEQSAAKSAAVPKRATQAAPVDHDESRAASSDR